MNKRLTIQGDVNIERLQKRKAQKPPWAKKYVMNRNNSLESVKRAYLYLNGNTKGMSLFLDKLKANHPEARRKMGDNQKMIQWFFDNNHLWDAFTNDKKMSKIIKAMRIDSWEELDARAYVY